MMSFHQDAIVHRVRAIHRPLSGSDSLIECSCCDSLLSDVLSSSAPTLCHSNSSISLQSTSEAGSSSVHSHSSSDDIVVSTEITSTTNLHDSSSCVVSPKGDINESDQLSIVHQTTPVQYRCNCHCHPHRRHRQHQQPRRL